MEVVMQTRQWAVRSGLVLSLLGAAGLMTALPAAAQTQKPTTGESGKSSTMAPARAGDDSAAEFTKLDKNKDGFVEKNEATMEPKLLGKWADADTNKDGKISKEEFLAFERKENTAKK
jgi:Ca2+-binding EF-hand superfamily protein